MNQLDPKPSTVASSSSESSSAERFPVIRKVQEYSFTLLEVIIATGLLVSVVLQVAGGQGSLLEITDYSKKATEATWLAKRIMSEVEANYINFELKDMDFAEKDVPFDDYKDAESDYKYTLTIEEWKLPLIDFLTGGGGKSEEEKEADKDSGSPESSIAGIPGLDGIVSQIFGDHMMKTAYVEVSWPDGARRNSVGLVYLLTNQKKLDEYLLAKTNTWDQIRKKMDPNAPKDAPPPSGVPGGTAPGTPGTPGNPANPGAPGTPGNPANPGAPGAPPGGTNPLNPGTNNDPNGSSNPG